MGRFFTKSLSMITPWMHLSKGPAPVTERNPKDLSATVAELKNQLSRYLRRAREGQEPIVVTLHGKPYALIQALDENALEELAWSGLARRQLERAWEDEDDALYDYL